MTPIRVLIADDHALVRAGIGALLRNIGGVEVVAEAGDGREALHLIGEHKPDVVLMDIAMPGLNGLEAVTRISREFPAVRVIILSMHASEEYVLHAMRAGASGYLLKGARTAELELAVAAVVRGEVYLSPAVSRHLVDQYVAGAPAGEPAEQQPGAADRLTPRQREILQLIAEGRTTKEIAGLLAISVKTVEMHRAQLMERLDITTSRGWCATRSGSG